MKKFYSVFLLMLLSAGVSWSQGQLQAFKDDVESNADFSQTNLNGWTSHDLDGFDTAGSFHEFPGKGGPLGFIVYTPDSTDPVNDFDQYKPRSGRKYFASVSSWDGPVNDWLISDELAPHPGGTFSFYAKSSFDYMGVDKFKVAYSTTGSAPSDFTFLNGGNTVSTSLNWTKYEFQIPADAKHVAINGVSQAVMLMIDDLQFIHTVTSTAPGIITDHETVAQIGADIEAVFSWTNPVVDFAGNPLGSMTGVKVFRGTNPMNLTEVADLPSGVGQQMTYTDLLPDSGYYIHRFLAYNASGNGVIYDTPMTFFGYESVPGAPKNIVVGRDASMQTVISWDPVTYGAGGGTLEDPVIGYTISRKSGNTEEVLATLHPETTFTETTIPDFYLYTYTITAQTAPDAYGIPGSVSGYSGMGPDQVPVTTGTALSEQVFELNETSIISQSIYYPEDIGGTGLITSLSYFGNLGQTAQGNYKIYMSTTDRDVFGTNLNNAVWEYFGNQKLVYNGSISFDAGKSAKTIVLDQPFFYDSTEGKNVVITIVKPLTSNPPYVNPANFYNTPVEEMRTYYAIGYSVDLSVITTQPASWATEEIFSIPSIVTEKKTDYGKVWGTVTQFSDGLPLEGVTVTISPDTGSYQKEIQLTDADGKYEIPALLPGSYTAAFSKDAYNTYETTFVLGAQESLELDAVMDNSLAISIVGKVEDVNGAGIAGVTLNLTGFSSATTVSDANGDFVLEGFAEKNYELKYFHPLYETEVISFVTPDHNHVLAPVTLLLSPKKPGNLVAVNTDGKAEVTWDVPLGLYNEVTIGWGSFLSAGDAWGNGGDPFVAGIRFEPADLENQTEEGSVLTHVKAYMANNAEIKVNVYEGADASVLIHSQRESVPEEGWYVFELTSSHTIDPTKELWIGLEFLSGAYGSYPIGLDDGPNAPGKKGSMLYENGSWRGMSLTNKNWNIYGVTNHTQEANPQGYKVYRSLAPGNTWTELTSDPVTETAFTDPSLGSQTPGMYVYGVTALYEGDLVSDRAVSNEVENNLLFDFTVDLVADAGSAEGAYVAIWNDDHFAEGFVTAGTSSVGFPNLMRGTYEIRVELDNYEIVTQSDVVVEANETINVPLYLLKVRPSHLTATAQQEEGTYKLDWTLHSEFKETFERYQDFERNQIGDYIMKDLDGLETYTYINFDWPNSGVPMAFMIFNPFATTPAPVDMPPFKGRRFLSAFAGPDGPNNDWFIIPAGSGDFSFYAASLVADRPERISVLYSTTGSDISDFTAFGNVFNVPSAWTKYTYEAPEGTKYVAINYRSNDTYILKVDDVTYQREYKHALSYNIYLDGTLVSEGVTEQSFMLDNLSPGTHIAEVEAVYDSGVSEKSSVEIYNLDIEDYATSGFTIYPNPSEGVFKLSTDLDAEVSILDLHGRVLYTTKAVAGVTVMEHNFASGTYIVRVKRADGISSKKLIIL